MSGPSNEELEALERQMRAVLDPDNWKPSVVSEEHRPVAEKLIGKDGADRINSLPKGRRYKHREPVIHAEIFYVPGDPLLYGIWGSGVGWRIDRFEDGKSTAILAEGMCQQTAEKMARKLRAQGTTVKLFETEGMKAEQRQRRNAKSQRRQNLERFGSFKYGQG